jgi:hypothetical protein
MGQVYRTGDSFEFTGFAEIDTRLWAHPVVDFLPEGPRRTSTQDQQPRKPSISRSSGPAKHAALDSPASR